MNESPPQDWYYTRGGEPVGPVSFDALKDLAGNFMLVPPLEMVWTEGMDDWAPVAKIEGLREAKRPWTPGAAALSGKDEWYYLVADVKTGPVTLTELKKKIADHSLEPPLKMVWTEGMPRWMPVYEVTELCEPLPSSKQGTALETKRDWADDEANLRAAAEMRAAAVARNAHPQQDVQSRSAAKAHEHAEAKAAEELRHRTEADNRAKDFKITAARVAAEEDAKIHAESDQAAKAEEEQARITAARAQAEQEARAQAEEQARLRAEAEARAAEVAAAQAKAEEQARIEAARAKAEQEARAQAEEQARLRAEAEARAAEVAAAQAKAEEQTRFEAARAQAEQEAEEQARLRAEAEARAEEVSLAAAAAHARAEEEAKRRAEAEARAEEIARAAAAAQSMAEQEMRLRLEAEAMAAEMARAVEAAHARVEEEARLSAARAKAEEEAKALAAEQVRLRKQAETRAADEARLRLEAQAKSIEDARLAVAAKVLAEHNAREHAQEAARLKATAADAAKLAAFKHDPAEENLASAPVHQQVDQAETLPVPDENIPAQIEIVVPPAPVPESSPLPAPPELPTRTGDPAKRVWHYTSNSNRLGPVTFEELRALAADKALNPRMDMVWKQGMDAWLSAGEVEGLFERASGPAESPQALAPAAPAIRPQRSENVRHQPLDGIWPGVRRRTFLLVNLLFPAIWGGALGAATPFLTKQLGPDLAGKVLPIAMVAPLLILIQVGIQRIANLGMSRWWYLANFIPFVNLWLGYRTFAGPAGYAIHKKLDKAGVVLAVIYWLTILLGILALAAGIAMLFGAVDNPEIQAKFKDLLRAATSKATTP